MRACPHERDLIHHLRSGAPSGPLAEHARVCPMCGETLKLTHYLGALTAAEPPATHLPAAGTIWWKAQIVRRLVCGAEEEAARRAVGPAFWGLTLGLAASGMAFLTTLAWWVATSFSGADPASGPALSWGWAQGTALALAPAAALAALGLLWREA